MTSKTKPIHAYYYTGYGSLKTLNRNLQAFHSLEEGLLGLEKVRAKGFYLQKQIIFIDYQQTPSRIIHILEPIIP